MCASDGRMPSTARLGPTAVSSERMPTRAATEMTAQRAHLSPRAIASDGSHVTMPAAAAPVPTRHVGAGLLPARRARVSARTHVEPGPRARQMLQHGVPDRRSSIWKPMPAGSAAHRSTAAAPHDPPPPHSFEVDKRHHHHGLAVILADAGAPAVLALTPLAVVLAFLAPPPRLRCASRWKGPKVNWAQQRECVRRKDSLHTGQARAQASSAARSGAGAADADMARRRQARACLDDLDQLPVMSHCSNLGE